jgi:amino acid transporter
VSCGLSRNGYVPVQFERLIERGVPWFAVIVAFIIGSICFLRFPSRQSLVCLTTSASVRMYAGAPLSTVAVFSLVIYYWAISVSLSREDILAIIGESEPIDAVPGYAGASAGLPPRGPRC